MRRYLGVALLVASTSLVTGGTRLAEAANLDAVGWWARTTTTNPGSESPVPAPAPTVPLTAPAGAGVGAGQVLVEGTPAGATAIAALKWTLSDTESSPSLVLPAAAGSALTVDAVVLACKAATPWTPPSTRPGTWESKPITDGTSCINGVVAADGSSVGFGLQPLVRKTVLDIVIVAGTALRLPDGANGSTFRFVFDDPGAAALSTIARPALSDDDASTDDATPPTVQDDPFFSAPTMAPSFSDLGSADTSAAAAPALQPQDLGPSVPRLEPATSTRAVASGARTLAALFLLGGSAVAAWLQRARPDLAGAATTVGLGPFRRTVESGAGATEPEVRGLAGFARPRTKPPVPL